MPNLITSLREKEDLWNQILENLFYSIFVTCLDEFLCLSLHFSLSLTLSFTHTHTNTHTHTHKIREYTEEGERERERERELSMKITWANFKSFQSPHSQIEKKSKKFHIVVIKQKYKMFVAASTFHFSRSKEILYGEGSDQGKAWLSNAL